MPEKLASLRAGGYILLELLAQEIAMTVSLCAGLDVFLLMSAVWERPNFHSSPCISRSLDAGIQVSGLTKDEIDLYDFYSCFPIVPKFACAYLGLPMTKGSKPVTLLGGLTSFGGAGNNYSMHVSCSVHTSLVNIADLARL